MKRRSARPFTVEVKHTRTARTSLFPISQRTHPGQIPWGDALDGAAADGSPGWRSPLPARPEPAADEAPARRILPSLVPTFTVLDEPDAPAIHTEPTPPRVRRPRPRKAAVEQARRPAEIPAVPGETPAAPGPVGAAAPVPEILGLPPAAAPARTARRVEARPDKLRPGERWKRRLPRALR